MPQLHTQHPATARLEAINCCLIGSVALSNGCVPVNALQNLSSPPMMHVHLPIWVVQRSPLSGPTIINLNMSHPSQVFSSCQFFCPRPASSRHWSIRASLPASCTTHAVHLGVTAALTGYKCLQYSRVAAALIMPDPGPRHSLICKQCRHQAPLPAPTHTTLKGKLCSPPFSIDMDPK